MKLGQIQNEKEFFKELTEHALTSEPSKFEFIKNWDMRCAVRLYKRGLKHVVRVYKRLYDSFLDLYKAEIAEGKFNLESLLVAKQFEACYKFYKKEYVLAKDILNEHLEYMFSGHLLDTFLFNRERPALECIDYRKIPGIWCFKKFK